MPGEFYIEGKREKVDISQILTNQSQILTNQDQLEDEVNDVKSQTDKLSGQTPATGSVSGDWQVAESDVVSIGAGDTKYKLHSLILSIHNLVGTVITIRLYLQVNEVERRVYEQTFDATSDPPSLWIVNGTVGIHEVLKVTLQSNDPADNGKSVDYDYMLEAM